MPHIQLPTVGERRQTLTIAEAASYLGIHRASLRAAIDRGEVHAIRIGRRWLVPRSALDELFGVRIARSSWGRIYDPPHSNRPQGCHPRPIRSSPRRRARSSF